MKKLSVSMLMAIIITTNVFATQTSSLAPGKIKTITLPIQNDTVRTFNDNKTPTTMTFILIPAGTFIMGSPEDETGRFSNETQYQVTLNQPFYMQTTEVTQGQWKAVMGNNPSYFSSCGEDCPVEQVSWHDAEDFIKKLNNYGQGIYRLPTEAEWEYSARAGSKTAFINGNIASKSGIEPNLNQMGRYHTGSLRTPPSSGHKMTNMSGLHNLNINNNPWNSVLDNFANPPPPISQPTRTTSGQPRLNIAALNKCSEVTYYLPLEDEQNYSVRTGGTTTSANDDTDSASGSDPNLNEIGWYRQNAGKITHKVAQKSPNAWCLYDMHGNAYEWCSDGYDPSYPSGFVTDPKGASSSVSYRVRRGGYWGSEARYCRSAYRGNSYPDYRKNGLGFRIVKIID